MFPNLADDLKGVDRVWIADNAAMIEEADRDVLAYAECKAGRLPERPAGGHAHFWIGDDGTPHVRRYQCRYEAARELMRRSLKRSSLGRRFVDRTFENFEQVPGTRAAYRMAREVAGDERLPGLLMSGRPGSGKTHLAAAIWHQNIERGVMTLFHDTSALFGQLRAASREGEDFERMIGDLIRVPVLILDDIDKIGAGMRDGVLSGFAQEAFYRVVNGRYEREGQLTVTLNGDLGVLERRLGEVGPAVASRLLEMCRYVIVEAADHRKARKGVSGVSP